MLQAHGNAAQAENYLGGSNQPTVSLVQQQQQQPNRPARLRPQSLQAPSQNQTRRDPRISWSNGTTAASAVDLQQFADDLTSSISFDGTSSKNSSSTSETKDSRGRTMEQEDALAIAQNGGTVEYSDDEAHDGADQDLDDDLMDRISSSPSIEDEDIDFDFVYALHTFVATVEGQANAVKGEPMMLLDDSNSYWWLVRVVKDSTIGYLPAEHIETPTERLARLNKHRNLDLSAPMLGDQPEPTRSKPSLRAGILRRRKSVAFAAPTYVDYEKEYSDESDPEDEAEALFAQQRAEAKKQREEKEANDEAAAAKSEEAAVEDETAKVKPLITTKKEAAVTTDPLDLVSSESESEEDADLSDLSKSEKDDGISRSRNGTVRNTDSFFKDDSVETKKITLTPNLLRDDNSSRESTESGSIRQGFSLDKLEKDSPTDKKEDKKKKDKKEKDKKPGGLRGFFSRKDKKKSVDEDNESLGKRSMDTIDSREREGADGENNSPTPEGRTTPQRTLSGNKLHKHQPRDDMNSVGTGAPKYVAEAPRNDVSNVPPASMRIVETEQQQQQVAQKAQRINNRASMVLQTDRTGPMGTLSTNLASISESPVSSNTPDSRLEKEGGLGIIGEEQVASQKPEPSTQTSPTDRAVSPPSLEVSDKQTPIMPVSPVDESPPTPTGPPALVADSSSQDDQSISPSSSPDLMGTDESGSTRQTTHGSAASDSRSSAASNVSSWNDINLRSFFETSSDVRDMLVVVYDKSEVVPAGPEHPIAGPLFREQNAKLAEITTQLDHMLGDWLARKQRLRGSI
ncbi:Tip elongation aberrant protein Tea4 [Ceratocystis fimbriata CBS 114723]|uniref:Tip elongation aberrant protein Tea4 n=1 Tax=Ceratocystis fimbriata CBS 114723 TaxID=1035309 RepID=A0A2C5WX01_9PEZI|nr:Tip elongation aberrant protein Tea4 [Ceratocystis fimbriata CBS 114723]